MPWAQSSLAEGMEWSGMECCHPCAAYFWWVSHKPSNLSLGPKQPSSPSTKDLHGQDLGTLTAVYEQ